MGMSKGTVGFKVAFTQRITQLSMKLGPQEECDLPDPCGKVVVRNTQLLLPVHHVLGACRLCALGGLSVSYTVVN